jgi:hypothetical protein
LGSLLPTAIIVYILEILSGDIGLDCIFSGYTIVGMKTKKTRGRPPKEASETKSETILIRLELGEKEGFRAAADVAGIDLSAWMRERLRRAARQELEEAGLPIPFLRHVLEELKNG